MSYVIRVIINNKQLYRIIAEEKKAVTFGSGKKDSVYVPGWLPEQLKLTLAKGKLRAHGKKINLLDKGEYPPSKLGKRICENPVIDVYAEPFRGNSDQKFKLPYRGIVTIGRVPDCTIQLNDEVISGHHVTITCVEGKFRAEDGSPSGRRSTNGTYLNGERLSIGVLKSGDYLDLMSIRIELINGELLFNNVGDCLSIHEPPDDTVPMLLPSRKYRRSPRIRESLPQENIVLARAPSKEGRFQKRRGMGVSFLSSGAMLGASLASGIASPALLAARAAGLIAPAASAIISGGDNRNGKRKWNRTERERLERYWAYVEAQKAMIQLTADQQRSIRNKENPSPTECMSIVEALKPTLWERNATDSDFLDVRVGMGYEPLCVNVKTPGEANGFQMEEDEAEKWARQVVEETRIVDQIPARIPLNHYTMIGTVGRRQNVVNLLRYMLITLTTAHYYEDVRIVGIFDESEKSTWESMRWLPHIWDSEKQTRFLAFDKESAEKLSDTFHEILQQRTQTDERNQARRASPHYIFILGAHKLVEKSKLLTDLIKSKPEDGVTTIFAYLLNDYSSEIQRTFLPPECQFLVDTDTTNGPCAYEFLRADRKFMFTQDEPVSREKFDRYCRSLSAVRVESSVNKLELPGGVTFLEGLGISNVKELQIWRDWESSDEPVLSAPLAVMSSGKLLELDIGDFAQPPVTLVAGMSGSGKSEFLKTWILSLSVRYSPQDLSIVIIDYKGGSMARSVEELPHVVGKITDIDSGDIMRPLASLSYEISRRELIFKKYGVEDGKQYRAKYRNGEITEILPMFLIVCDEFAELKQQHPDFIKKLVDVARRGRSCGMRLILATQSPAGVVDQNLVDNSRFQICLKVQNSAASKCMINRPDAARITQNGRAYVRAGSDEIFELVQTFWTGAPYFGNPEKKASTGNQVRLVNMGGERIKTVAEEKTRFKSDLNELDVVISYIRRVAKTHGISEMPCPWKPELPKSITLQELGVKGGFDGADWRDSLDWLKVPLGIYDIPELQEQGIQYLNFERDGHCAIYGLPGSGKTTLLKTIIMGLGLYFTPKDVNLYILDLGSQTLKMFEHMPHVGTVVIGSEEDKLKKTAVIIENILAERKRIFARNGVSSLKNYREEISKDMPAVILAIDNFLPLFELCREFEELIYRIANEGSGYGIYLLYTANNPNGIRYKLTQNIRCDIALEMNSKSDFNDIVGKVESDAALKNRKGRAFFRESDGPVMFQTALYGEGETEKERGKWVKAKVDAMCRFWDKPAAEQVPSVPEVLQASDLHPFYTEIGNLPVGLETENAKPVFMELGTNLCGMIIGNDINRRTKSIYAMTDVMKHSRHPHRFYIFSAGSEELKKLRNEAEGFDSSCTEENVDLILKQIITELMSRQNNQKSEMQRLGTEFDAKAWQKGLPMLCMVIEDLPRLMNLMENAEAGADKRLRAIIKNAAGLGMMILAGCDALSLIYLKSNSPIVNNMVASQTALVLEGKVSDVGCYEQNTLSVAERNAQIAEGTGMLICGGTIRKVKPIQ